MASESEEKKPWGDIELEEIPDLTELQDEVVEQAKDKEWKTHGKEGAAKVVKKCAKSKRKKKMTERQISNLVQFRDKDERSEESKQASLEQLRVPVKQRLPEEDDEGSARVEFPDEILEQDMIRSVLTIPEQEYFVRRWQEFMTEHQNDFNKAEDYDAIVEMIMCHVNLFRIAKRKKNSQSLAWDRGIGEVEHNLHLRIGNLRRDLKTSRKARLETHERKETNLMNVITSIAKQNQSRLGHLLEENLAEQMEFENEMLRRKRQRSLLPPTEVLDVDAES